MSGADYDHNNIFAKIIRGEIPSHKIFETEHSLAILDAFPVTEGHALLLPKVEGYATMDAMPPDVASAFLADLPKLAKAVKEGTGADGLNICQNNGKCSGQEVPHVHVHVIPRYNNDTLGIKFPASSKEMITPEQANKFMDLMTNSGSGAVGIDRRMIEAQRKRVEELRRLRASRMKAKSLSENSNTSNSLDRQIQAILSEALSIDEQLANLDNLDVTSDKNKSMADDDAARLKAMLFRKPKLETLTSQSVVHIDSDKRVAGMISGKENGDVRREDVDSYEKGIQCDDESTETGKGDTMMEVVADTTGDSKPTSHLGSGDRRRSSVRNPIFPRRGSTALDRMKAAARASNLEKLPAKGVSQTPIGSLSEEEKEAICQRRDFGDFLQRASKIVEKAIGISELSGCLEVDPFIDYATEERLRDSGGSAGKESAAALRVTDRVFASFGEEGRLGEITDLRWHGGIPELFIACSGAGSWQCHNRNRKECPSVAVWSIAMPKRPEFVLKSHTAVVTAMSDKFKPTLYVGGSVSGSVLIWDTRAKFSPVQWSPAIGSCARDDNCCTSSLHTQPICGMELVGTKNAHHITTVSREGKVCLWSTAQLVGWHEASWAIHLSSQNEPHHSVLFKDADQRDYSVSTVAFSEADANLITFGTYDGHIVKAQLDTTTGNTNPGWQVAKASALAHDGMVTALDYHPLTLKRHPDDILASGSLDWTVKLWNGAAMEHCGNSHVHTAATDLAGLLGTKETSPAASIATVDSYKDTLTDVRWHPHHPAVLATSSAEGIHICNFNRDTESPVLSIRTPGSSVQRLAWNGDGRLLLAGDAEGRVTLYEADRSIYQPRAGEWNR
ncbi:Cytoplasmic dynein 1 intermediate chain 2 [Perkinsus chesapeaki]|uniref:Cytoplasmic dynein 1 intermediate chain 2 n=1 Tax=Perkinsus chesapeaki TaxID=330153 RepID=A0A7J6MG56_PERCH|nr:Cytoplasmic dynein 1 intermediate chain 2 [Perkinsus chesapeaki]